MPIVAETEDYPKQNNKKRSTEHFGNSVLENNMLLAKNICHNEAEDITVLPENTVLISIGNPHDDFWKLKEHPPEKVHKQVFADTTAKVGYDKREYLPINKDQAFEVVTFIEENKDKHFIVNCHAGISRSGAVCLFINKNYGHSLKKDFWALSHPNPYVFGMLQNAYELHIKKLGDMPSIFPDY